MNGESVFIMESSMPSDSTQQLAFTGFDDVQGTSIQFRDVLFNVLAPNEPRLLVQRTESGKIVCGEIDLSNSFIKDHNLVVLGNYDISPEIYP